MLNVVIGLGRSGSTRTRDHHRRVMSADARPFVPSSDVVSSEGPSMPDISGGGQSGSSGGTRNEHLSANQQQLGDRLYPKVSSFSAVRFTTVKQVNPCLYFVVCFIR